MRSTFDIVVIGGGTGGVAAAIGAARHGLSVLLTEETGWVGGQLTSQAVPPDEHPWIEQFGCTALYREYRNRVRDYYRRHYRLTPQGSAWRELNPGGGIVSRLCHEPRVGAAVLAEMLRPFEAAGNLTVRLHTALKGGAVLSQGDLLEGQGIAQHGDEIESATFLDLRSGAEFTVTAKFFIDATELGDVLPQAGAEYRVGAESIAMTGEPSAKPTYEPDNVQAITHVFAMRQQPGEEGRISKPEGYESFRDLQPSYWPHRWFSLSDLDPITLEPRNKHLVDDDPKEFTWFRYRQIVDPRLVANALPATIVNWPQNDYFAGTIIDVSRETFQERTRAARNLSLSWLYWLQNECPRPDGGNGYPDMALAPDLVGTHDGLAMTPYIRESRRIVALRTVVEGDVATKLNPGLIRAPKMPDSVGVGGYRIDLHPSTGNDNYLDVSSLPFQIPLGSLVPVRLTNLLPAAKNLGVTHITNGCYRLHPVEWNIGEAAGELAVFCIANRRKPQEVAGHQDLTSDFQRQIHANGIETDWPTLRPF